MPRCAPDALAVGVNDLAQARAVLAWAAAGRRRPPRLYGLDAPFMGAGFWREVERLLARPLVVDCGDHVGTAMEALRVGCRRLRLVEAGPQEAAVAGLVAAHGALRVTAPPAVALVADRPVAAQLARARWERVTGPLTPDKDLADAFGFGSETGHVACD